MRKARRTKVLGWRWRRNPLRRHSDAVEARVILAAWALATVGGAAAGAVSAHAMETGTAQDQAERRQVTAVLLETAPSGVRDLSTGTKYDHVRAKVRWTDGDGTVRTDNASVKGGAKVGTAVSVWTDGHQELVSAPIGPAEAAARVVLTGTGGALAGGLVILAGGRVVRLRIERRATGLWGEEWDRIGPQWGRKTG
ncbi:Rv1733c family protein [Streptomyces sp. 2A115]|uniref:Rv1733c family protein n=1 Tax=Streptomyces sp. 2A115 TaxID=3457439 RepID=UPI003FD637B6